MRILHAALDHDRLRLWMEVADDGRAARRPGRQRRTATTVATPITTAGSDLLRAALVECGFASAPRSPATAAVAPMAAQAAATAAVAPAIMASSLITREAVIWLPSLAGQPIPSSPLIGAAPSSTTPPSLSPWLITALSLPDDLALTLLATVLGRTTLTPGLLIGADLAYWASALRLAGAAVARQQVVPDVVADSGRFRAAWRPLWKTDDAPRRSVLAAAMPAVARALTADSQSSPTLPAAVALDRFLDWAVDRLMRIPYHSATTGAAAMAPAARAITQPVSTAAANRRRRRTDSAAADFDSLHDQWLAALAREDGALTGRPEELTDFQAQVQAWHQVLTAPAAASFRLCFRLEEPAPTETVIDQTASDSAQRPGGDRRRPVAAARRRRPPTANDDESNSGRPPTDEASAIIAAPTAAWSLHYLLQAVDDPSLLVEAADAWQERGLAAQLMRRGGLGGRQILLTALGQAAGVSPAIAASLRQAQPAGTTLDTAGAHAFLTNDAAALEQAGFGVMLPAWWTRLGARRRLTARATSHPGPATSFQGQAGLTLDTLLRVDWQVALGDHSLTLAELETLAALKAPLVQVRGQWVEVDAAELAEALTRWRGQASREMTAGELVRLALGSAGDLGGLPVDGVTADGWFGELLAQLQGQVAFAELPPPRALQGRLRPYQARGYSWLAFLTRWGLGACLADDMGLGKTIQTLALLARARQAGERRPSLLVCPTSVVTNWQKEAARFTPKLSVLVHHGPERAGSDDFARLAARQGLVVTSYALLARDLDRLQSIDWAGVILDEAQNIKNAETRQARAARALRADYRLALTGTPVENNVGDLWSIMEFLNPGLLGSRRGFTRTFFIPIQTGQDATAAERLRRLTGPFILRRLKSDPTVISDLPAKQEMTVYCTLTAEQASLYQAVVDQAGAELSEAGEGMQRRGLILATLTRLKQVCNHPAQFLADGSAIAGRSGKLTRLTELLEEILAVGERTLIFTQYAEMGLLLQQYCQATFGRETLFLHGGVPRKQRDAMVEHFQSDTGPSLFVLSLKAGGTGLTLTRATHVFHVDRWWNPAVENQATDRAYRIGQTRTVQVHRFVCAGTIEERIDELITRKQTLAEQIVGSGEEWLTELSTTDLRDLMALRAEAVSE